jgi:hypothetical protein
MREPGVFHDELVPPDADGLPDRFFDRFVFNLHPSDYAYPSVIFGFGTYPPRDTVDGFAVVSTEAQQRNLRFSTELSATDGAGCGPFRFRVVEPNRVWKLSLADNPAGVEFDLTWRARTPAWFGEIAVANTDGVPSSFDHLFQSGYYEGTLTIDGQTRSVDGWFGQRDRSRGVRNMSGGQGLHLWCQAQFPDCSIGFLLVETRDQRRVLLEGAVMHESGELDPIVDVKHDLTFDRSLDLRSGTLEVRTAHGQYYRLETDASARGGYMAGAGYGGQHGKPVGIDHIEYDVYPLDGSVSPRTLDSSLTDRLAEFRMGAVTGRGILEFALSRSRAYEYRATRADTDLPG